MGRSVALALAALLWLGPAAARTPVEVALVLAVDASASVNYHEFNLQMQGLAAAFRDPRVVAAIEQAGPNGVAVCLLQWSGAADVAMAVDWRHLRNGDDAAGFAAAIAGSGRLPSPSGTAIGLALRAAQEVHRAAPFDGLRRVIDVSGDGATNLGVLPQEERDRAVAQGITINGLAILNEEPRLDVYYADYVIGGPGSFVIVAADYQDFARAIRLKLLREFGAGAVALR